MTAPRISFEVAEADDPICWDAALANSPNAHPLQSWEWGAAKLDTGSEVLRLQVLADKKPMLQAQIFIKPVPFVPFRIGWIPKGPVWCSAAVVEQRMQVLAAFRRACRQHGIYSLVSQPYLGKQNAGLGFRVPILNREQTFCLDLSAQLADLEQNLHSGWRNHKRRFVRNGGQVIDNRSESAVDPLIDMYSAMTARKSFQGYGGPELLRAVWRRMRIRSSGNVYAQIFQAVAGDRVCASILVLRAGPTALYVWGAFDYESRNLYPTEAVQWSAIETLQREGVITYDLGGADERNRSGVFEFKRRMGAKLLTLPPSELIVTV